MTNATRASFAILAALAATPALADPGHFAAERGHSHWLALAALAIALVVGIVALRRERRARAARKDAGRRA